MMWFCAKANQLGIDLWEKILFFVWLLMCQNETFVLSLTNLHFFTLFTSTHIKSFQYRVKPLLIVKSHESVLCVHTNFTPDFTHHTTNVDKSCNNFPLTLHLAFSVGDFPVYGWRWNFFASDKNYLIICELALNIFTCFHLPGTAVPYSPNKPSETHCVNWNQYYTNCTQLGGNPFQGTISFDNIGLAWVAIFLVIIASHLTWVWKMAEKVLK